MTDARSIVYRLCAQTVLLLVWYAGAALLAAVKFLAVDPLANALPYSQVNGFANVLLHLTLITGLLAGGLYLARLQALTDQPQDERGLLWVWRGWTLFLVLAVLAGLLGLLEGRADAELPFVLDVAEILLLAVWLVTIIGQLDSTTLLNTPTHAGQGTTRAAWNGFLMVWTAGLGLCIVGLAVGLLPVNDLMSERVLSVLSQGLRDTLGLGSMGLAVAFWILTRVSNSATGWIEGSLLRVAGVFLVAGALTSAAQVLHLPNAIQAAGIGAALFSVFASAWLIMHSYRALSNRAPIHTLAAHWFVLGAILLSVGHGVLGAILSLPMVHAAVVGTQLTVLQHHLSAVGLLAWVLGFINQAVAEMRGQNFRITGLVPFWCVALGLGGASLAFFAAGVVQLYLERLMSMGYLETQAALVPLYALWVGGLLIFAPGVAFYALGFRARPVDVEAAG
jgi:nitric oxide reductase subunit B